MNTKNILITLVAFVCLIIILFAMYRKSSIQTIAYSGLGESENSRVVEVKKDILITDNDILNSDKIQFVQRKIMGGGSNPGWVISLLETQPNIFTGRVIVDDGIYQHPVTLKEDVTNVFVGEMKGVNGGKEVFSMKKQDKNCIDEEGNIFEYTLSGAYGATQFSGCGGDVVKVSE